MSLFQDVLAVLGAMILTLVVHLKYSKRPRYPYPPGPKKLPLLGNVLDLPGGFEWLAYARWSQEYNSDLIHLSLLGSDIVVLHSVKAATDLCEKRSSIYSSRPSFTMINEVMGTNWMLSNMAYSDRWRHYRKLFTKYFHPNNLSAHEHAIIDSTRQMVVRLLDAPEDFMNICEYSVASMALTLAYGIPIEKKDDPHIELAAETLKKLSTANIPGTYFVDILPILRFIPEWVPGAQFQKFGQAFRRLQEKFKTLPFDATIRHMASGTAKPSFTTHYFENLQEGSEEPSEREAIKDIASMVFAAGADTTRASLDTFFLAMTRYPEVQARAQEELDRVLRGRLPEYHDDPDLPYLSAVVKEVMRWQPVTPISVPHVVTEDDVYEGYYIPKDAIIIPNVWAMLHDAEVYPDPTEFKPERFLTKDGKLNPEVPDPTLIAFGFGRRICPGSHIALYTLWLGAATILSTLQISKAVDENGKVIEPEVKYRSSIVHSPAPFKCAISSRSKATEALIRSLGDVY